MLTSGIYSKWSSAGRRALCAPSAFFAFFSGSLFLIYLLAASLTSFSRFFMDVSGIDLLVFAGSGSNIGPNKLLLLRILMNGCLVVTACMFLLLIARRGIIRRIFILAVLLPAYIGAYSFLHYPVQYGELLEQIEIAELPVVDPALFSKSSLSIEWIHNEDELYQACRARFEKARKSLKEQWGIEDGRKLEALYLMNTVSAFWGYGNRVLQDRVGCVSMNEKTAFRLDAPDEIGDYLRSEIGCCSDFAYILKLLLDRAGIPNRRVIIAHGHAMNEVYLPCGWMTLDATTNMAFDGDWTSIQKRHGRNRNSVHVFVFPHSNQFAGGNPLYRPGIGHLRFALLLDAVNKSACPVAYPDGYETIRPAPPIQLVSSNSR